jgi:hypothetical protein
MYLSKSVYEKKTYTVYEKKTYTVYDKNITF